MTKVAAVAALEVRSREFMLEREEKKKLEVNLIIVKILIYFLGKNTFNEFSAACGRAQDRRYSTIS